MARPSRIKDTALADGLRTKMRVHSWNSSDVARLLKVNKGTVSRALNSDSFSPALRPKVADLVDPDEALTISEMLHKSLHKLELSDMMRREAEALICRALDLTRQKQ